YKTRLQEYLARDSRRPLYSVQGTGPDHNRTFTATVTVEGAELGVGSGRSKKAAEQAAAKQALSTLEAES
ncbi:MAG: ribonuclease III, partial [Anaerolineae bacterium]|nr:ribonuclease III [Anaerolineae bacterium]